MNVGHPIPIQRVFDMDTAKATAFSIDFPCLTLPGTPLRALVQ